MVAIRPRRLCPAMFGVLICGSVLVVGEAEGVQFASPVRVGTVQSTWGDGTNGIDEASGIAASRQNANVLWVHNDSLDTARVFAMNVQGAHLATYNLSGATANDCEDIAIGPGPVSGQSYLYLGDIGDNASARSSIKVYRVAEPGVSSIQSPIETTLGSVTTIRLAYPDGARDAETLMVDPLTKDIYVVSKRVSHSDAYESRLYRAPYSESTGTITMEYVTQLPWGGATGGDISSNGNDILVRGYSNASLWSRPTGGTIAGAFGSSGTSVPLASEGQGEAICFDAAGRGYYTTREGLNQPIYYVARLPEPGVIALLSSAAIAVFLCRKRPRWNSCRVH